MIHRRVSSPTLVGRRDELTALRDAFAAASSGEATVVIVGGEAGVGKTRLLTELVGDLPEPAHVVWGRCMAQVDGGAPYGAVRDGLRNFVRSLDPAARAELEAHASPELAPLFPDLGEDRPGRDFSDQDTGQVRMFELFVQALAFLASQRPVVLVIDDLHWADRSTLSLLGFLIQNLTSERVLVSATYRSDELDRRHPLTKWLVEQLRGGDLRIELNRLDRSQLADQIEAILGAVAPLNLVDEIFVRSGGNPFFTEELVAVSAEGESKALPTSVRELLLVRLASLTETCQAVVRAASAARTPIDPWILAHVIDASEEALFDPLREAVDHHVLEADGARRRFVFRHALLREAAYSEVVPGERQYLHRRYAEAIEGATTEGRVDADEATSELAFHWHEAGDARRALGASLAAAEAATAARGFDNAGDHYQRALELWEAVPNGRQLTGLDHAEVLARAARAAHLAGDDDRATTLMSAALEETDPVADPARTARLYASLSWYQISVAPAAALRAYESALSLSAGQADKTERLRVLAIGGRLHMLLGQHDQAREFCEQALKLARTLGAKKEEVLALNPLGVVLVYDGRFDDGIARLRRALAIAQETQDFVEMASAYVYLGHALRMIGHLRESVDVSVRGAELAPKWGLDNTFGASMRMNAADALFELGEWAEMHALIHSVEKLRAHASDGFSFCMGARLHAARGDFVRARKELEVAQKLLTDDSQPDLLRGIYEVTAELALWEHRPDHACSAARDGLNAVAGGADHVVAGHLLMLALRAQAELADEARARRSQVDEKAAIEGAKRAKDLANTFDRNPLEPSLSSLPESPALQAQAAAELARCEGRHEPEQWQTSAELWEKLERPYQVAYARWRGAEAALLSGERHSHAADNLRSAHEIASRLGAHPLLTEIEQLARRARISLSEGRADFDAPTPPDADSWERFGLTARELDVLRYLADGRSDKEIAQLLFISAKTASVHVSNIKRKLQAESRIEAATIALRAGLPPIP